MKLGRLRREPRFPRELSADRRYLIRYATNPPTTTRLIGLWRPRQLSRINLPRRCQTHGYRLAPNLDGSTGPSPILLICSSQLTFFRGNFSYWICANKFLLPSFLFLWHKFKILSRSIVWWFSSISLTRQSNFLDALEPIAVFQIKVSGFKSLIWLFS